MNTADETSSFDEFSQGTDLRTPHSLHRPDATFW